MIAFDPVIRVLLGHVRCGRDQFVQHPRVLWDHSREAAKVFTWANETYFDTDLAPLREAFGGLMDFGTGWSARAGHGS